MLEPTLAAPSAAMPSPLGEQFDDLDQQTSAATLGMWIFLATEVLFFGAMFMAYAVYRATYPAEFARAGRELNVLIGTINTAVLLTSSLFMALAVHAAKHDRVRATVRHLALTWVLGLCFMGLKAYEYYDDVKKGIVPGAGIAHQGAGENVARLLYFIYYAMTGLHATHMLIGLGLVAYVIRRTARAEFSRAYHGPVEVVGLYWHFVDLIWIFLYPLLYLMDRNR